MKQPGKKATKDVPVGIVIAPGVGTPAEPRVKAYVWAQADEEWASGPRRATPPAR